MDTISHLTTNSLSEKRSMLLELPFELKQTIIGFCDKSGLSALSSTHSTLTETAETLLYKNVHICTTHTQTLTCLRTLSNNSHKAGLVRCLIMEYHSPETVNHEVLTKEASHLYTLAEALKNMHGLYDLKISCWSLDDDDSSQLEPFAALNDVISAQHFSLRILYCDHIFDLVRIIKSQPSLETVGIYRAYISSDIIEIIIQLEESKTSMPNIFGLGREGRILQWNTFTLFPETSADYESGMLVSKVAQTFKNHRTYRSRIAHRSTYTEFYIFLSDFSNLTAIKTLLESILENFSCIVVLHIYLREDCEIPFKFLAAILSKFSQLSELVFDEWDYRGNPEKSLGPISSQIHVPHTIEKSVWTSCPELSSIVIGGVEFVPSSM